jgi:hypothetical protein
MNSQERRMGENEILYREVNEQVAGLQDRLGLDEEYVDFVCECAQLECSDRIRLTRGEYEEVRASGNRFAVTEGHEEPSVEHVVARTDRFLTIEKDEGGPAELARSADPR